MPRAKRCSKWKVSVRRFLSAGSAFYEPAGKVILRFDNASPCEKMRFICYYLLEGEQELIEMLPQEEEPEHVFIAD